MSPESRPEATPFDPGSTELPPALGPALSDPDIQILLIVAPDSGDPAARTAIGLAEAAAAAGPGTVVLADAGFGDARIHRMLDVPNLEGLADIFEFGASVGRVSTRPDTRAFEFIPTGPYVPDAEGIMRSDRWDTVAHELEAESATMLLFVPATVPGLAAFSERVGRAIVVGDPMSVDRTAGALDPSCEVLAVLEPAGPMALARLAAEAGEPGEVDATIFDDPNLTEPVIFRTADEERGISPRLWVLMILAVALGGWVAWDTFSDDAPQPAPVAVETEPTAPPAPAPEPVETPVGYSVAVEAHQDLATARERLARLEGAEPELGFYLAPVSVNGSLYYRVLSGPVADQESAMALQRELVDAGLKTAVDSWAVRPTTYAFLLGEFEDPARAERRIDGLRELGIPAYITPIDYEPGDVRYRVYGGAFESETAAEVMAQMLADARIDAPLVERVGIAVEVGT